MGPYLNNLIRCVIYRRCSLLRQNRVCSRYRNKYRIFVEYYWQRKQKYWEKTLSQCLFVRHKPFHGVVLNWTPASTLRCRRLKTWKMVQLLKPCISICNPFNGRHRIPVRVRFSTPIQTGPRAHPTFYTMSTESFLGVNRPGCSVDHPPHQVPKLKKEYSSISTRPLSFSGLF